MRDHPIESDIYNIRTALSKGLVFYWTCQVSVRIVAEQRLCSCFHLVSRRGMVFPYRGCLGGFLTGVVLLAFVPCLQADNTGKAKVRILLLGDSTVIGSVGRHVAPKADHLEDVIRKLLAAEKDLPSAEVINQGR